MQNKILLFFLLFVPAIAQETVQFAASTSEAEAREKARQVGGYVVKAVVKNTVYYRVQRRYSSASEAALIAGRVKGFITVNSAPQVKSITIARTVNPTVTHRIVQPIFHPFPSIPPEIWTSLSADLPPALPSANLLPTIKTSSYELVIPSSWVKNEVTYPDCSDGLLFLPPNGGAAIQVFVLGEKLAQASNQFLVDYTVDVMSRLTGIRVLATQPLEEDRRLSFDLKLQSQVSGKGMILRKERSILVWGIARPAEYEAFAPIIDEAIRTLR